MDTINQLLNGFGQFWTNPLDIALAAAGVLLGTVVGLLPGLGPSTAIALLLPLALALDPEPALIMMTALYLGAEYGGRISAILLNMPGDAGAIMTTLDGYPMASQGRASTALAISAVGGFVGGTLALVGLVFLAAPLSSVGLAFGPSAYFGVVVMALLLSGTLIGGSVVRGGIAIALGLMLATVGTDLQTGIPRFTFGLSPLLEGISPIIPIIGVFGIGEIFWGISQSAKAAGSERVALQKRFWPRWGDILEIRWTVVRASVVGFIAGVLPGSGTTLASFFSYSVEKRVSKTPEKFGTGVVHGLAGPETANNAAVGGSFVPMFTLGIPGSGTTAVLLAYLIVYGLDPGPSFFTQHGQLAWTIIASLFISSVVGLALNLPLVPLFAKILDIPRRFLFPVIMVLALLSGYALSNSVFDAELTLLFGVVGYLMRLAKISPALLVIAMILGDMLETSFRQAYLLANGDVGDMLLQPLTVAFLIVGVLAVLLDGLRNLRKRPRQVEDEGMVAEGSSPTTQEEATRR